MSILIKGNSSTSGGSSKGFPTDDLSNISVKSGVGCVLLSWSDPSTSIYNGTTLSTWSSTIVVRKEGSAPSSIKDGDTILTNTIKDTYANTPYTDNNVVVGKTYYYRFYTLSTDKVYNDSTSMIYSVTITDFDPILANNSWEQIIAASEAGKASELWNVGDEINLTLSGVYTETVTLQIWDFNHFYTSDSSSSGTAGICFGTKNLMQSTQKINSYYTNQSGWNNTNMKNYIMSDILQSMPSALKNGIKQVNTFANQGSSSSDGSYGYISKDKVFIPGFTEVFGKTYYTDQSKTEQNQKQFPIFTDNNSRIKYLSNGNGNANTWWLRSPCYYNSTGFFCITRNGGYSDNSPDVSSGVCFCFNV